MGAQGVGAGQPQGLPLHGRSFVAPAPLRRSGPFSSLQRRLEPQETWQDTWRFWIPASAGMTGWGRRMVVEGSAPIRRSGPLRRSSEGWSPGNPAGHMALLDSCLRRNDVCCPPIPAFPQRRPLHNFGWLLEAGFRVGKGSFRASLGRPWPCFSPPRRTCFRPAPLLSALQAGHPDKLTALLRL